jgi:Ala-tRNA(Pro) deacylase
MQFTMLANYLDKHQIGYTTIQYPGIITEKELEGVSHSFCSRFAKPVMVKADDSVVLIIIPSGRSLDLDAVRESLNLSRAELASREEFDTLFPGWETDAVPPFGKLSGIPVYIDKDLATDDSIAFNAGDHHEVIMMPFREFSRLVQPEIMSFPLKQQ